MDILPSGIATSCTFYSQPGKVLTMFVLIAKRKRNTTTGNPTHRDIVEPAVVEVSKLNGDLI